MKPSRKRAWRAVTAAMSATLLAGVGVGFTASSASAEASRCEVNFLCLYADLDSNGEMGVAAVDLMPSGYCAPDVGFFDNLTTSVNNGSQRNVVIYEHPGCTGRALVLPPMSYFPDLREQGFDDIVSSIRF